MDNALFVAPGPICLRLSPTKLFGLVTWQLECVRRSSHYLYLDTINSREWGLNLILREIEQANCIIFAQALSDCDRKPEFLVFSLKIASHQCRNVSAQATKAKNESYVAATFTGRTLLNTVNVRVQVNDARKHSPMIEYYLLTHTHTQLRGVMSNALALPCPSLFTITAVWFIFRPQYSK